MKLYRIFLFIAVALALTRNPREAWAQSNIEPQAQAAADNSHAQPKIIKAPISHFVDEAVEKKIEGKVELSVVVDGKGRVTDAKVLSGPPALLQVAIESVKQWEFEPPAHPPFETRVEISIDYPKECPGPISDAGGVSSGGWLKSKNGLVISEDFDSANRHPPYFDGDRKAGIVGTMILSVTVMPDGKVKNVRIIKSLSPRLDEAALKTIKQWRFKLIKGSPDGLPDDFELPLTYSATCSPHSGVSGPD
jgi:TonB family protein